jgi:HEAT repeat protein
MAFYDLPKNERTAVVENIGYDILAELKKPPFKKTIAYFRDDDTYVRKSAYLSLGKIYSAHKTLHAAVIKMLDKLLPEEDFKIRQTVINAAGEIGKSDFQAVQHIFDKGLFDKHHSPRNAVIGSIKKMGEVNPEPVLKWAAKHLQHKDSEIRREICHGIELRGRKHPQEILPLLKKLENDKVPRVSNTLVHVLGQIAYKKGCLEMVVEHLKTWENNQLVAGALEEIIHVHHRYKDFSHYTQKQARQYIKDNFTF